MSTLGWYNIVYINSNYFYWEMWLSVTLRNFNFIYTWYIFSCNIIYFSLHIDFSKKIFLFQGSSDWLEWLTEVSELLSEVTGRYTNYCSLGFVLYVQLHCNVLYIIRSRTDEKERENENFAEREISVVLWSNGPQ